MPEFKPGRNTAAKLSHLVWNAWFMAIADKHGDIFPGPSPTVDRMRVIVRFAGLGLPGILCQGPVDRHSVTNRSWNGLSNRVFEIYEAIVDAACEAWTRLAAQPQTIMSIGLRD